MRMLSNLRQNIAVKLAAKASFLVLVLAAAEGCGSSLSQPFDKMKDQPMTIYRLQNYEPQPTAQGTPGQIQLPPQLQQWAQAAAGLLPPNLLPPGLLPGTTAPAPAQDVPRFHGARILSYQQVTDTKLRGDVLDIFGHESNFTEKYDNCPFFEFGFAIQQPNGQLPADIMVSLSCTHVQAYNFAWPYQKIGIPPETAKKIAQVVQRAFGGG
jgi:hypothetical protein